MEFIDIAKKRYAVKKFTSEKISEENIEKLKEMIQLAPSSFGLQPWTIKIITSQELKDRLQPASFNQVQIGTCSHLLVFCTKLDMLAQVDKYGKLMEEKGIPSENIEGFKKVVQGYMTSMSKEATTIWAQKQIYIALGNAMNGATALGFDSCPMEGFNPEEYTKILSLPGDQLPTVVLPVGYAADEAKPKIRFPIEEMFQKIE